MATGTGNLPNQNMSFSPFAILTAEEMNDLVENIESLADASGIGDGAIDTTQLADGAVTSDKIDFTTFPSDPNWDTGWITPTLVAGFTDGTDGFNFRIRRIGNFVNFQGRVLRNAGVFPAGTTTTIVTALPANLRPSYNNRFPSAMYAGLGTTDAQLYIEITTAGAVSVGAKGDSSNTVYFGAVTYIVD